MTRIGRTVCDRIDANIQSVHVLIQYLFTVAITQGDALGALDGPSSNAQPAIIGYSLVGYVSIHCYPSHPSHHQR